MARIRNIKPDFWTDEKLVELETWERLLFIGLWNFADDEGYMAYSPKRIKMQIFPGDSLEVSRGIQSLISIGAVRIYDSELGPVLHITNWSKHQKVSNPSKSKYSSIELHPAGEKPLKLAESAANPREDSDNSTEDSRGLRKEREGEREGIKDLSSKPDEFDAWYSTYPRKEAKEAARKAFAKARKTATLEQLIEGLTRYSAAMANKERHFIALPATWLNAGRWQDEYEAPRTNRDVLNPANWG